MQSSQTVAGVQHAAKELLGWKKSQWYNITKRMK